MATRLQVLLVEDNEIDIEITRRVLERGAAAVELRVARDGSEALEVLFDGRGRGTRLPALILLDLGLPWVDGREVLRRIKRHPELCPVPVAVLTGASGSGALTECLELGSNMYFVKPMTVRDAGNLVAAVRRYWEVLERLRRDRSEGKGAS